MTDGDEQSPITESSSDERDEWTSTDGSSSADSEKAFRKSLHSMRNAIGEGRRGIGQAVRAGQHWVQEQPLWVRSLFALGGAWIANEALVALERNARKVLTVVGRIPDTGAVQDLVRFLSESLRELFTTERLVLLLLGLYLIDSSIRTQKLNTILDELLDMKDEGSVKTDGGTSRNRTSGGGALGGAIAGGALGSAAGPQGTLVGVFLGLVIGDELEQKSEKRSPPRDEMG